MYCVLHNKQGFIYLLRITYQTRFGREMSKTERRYGFFRCTKCNAIWESAYVHCVEGTNDVSSLSLYENIGIPHEPSYIVINKRLY